ncbi:MAG TPA: hypothetical protein VGB87_16615 [Vicinamibacteria bacterium]
MRPTLRVTGLVVLASVGPATPSPVQEAAAAPAPRAGATPIRDSVERAIDAVVLKHLQPCRRAREQGVPCFPTSVEEEGPRFSVAEALRRYRGKGSPAPGPPTVAEIQSQMSGAPQSASGGVGFDPGCTAKKLFGKLRGTTFYLYRTWDARGERPMLTDRPLDPTRYAANVGFQYELLGKFSGECEAVAAWRAALRRATEPPPLEAEDWREPPEAEAPPP